MDAYLQSMPLQARPASSPGSNAPVVSAAARVEEGAPAQEFADMLGEAIAGAARQLRRAEAVSLAGIRGTASTQEVVEQVMSAEQALQASIAIRDKIVAAYLEISRMQV